MNKIPMLEKFAAQSLVEHDGELIFSKEKFAELIVEDVLDVCKKQKWNSGFNQYKEGIRDTMKSIKEHFGVEE